MSKTEYMGVSPSQVTCQTGNYSCHKQSPSGQKHEFGAESVHSEPSEQKRQPDFEILEDEPRETIIAVSSQLINENLQPILENVTNNCFTENLEPPPKDVHESSQTGKCLCSQKDILEQKLEFGSGSCEPSEEFQKLGSQLVENELVETCTTVSSFIASEQLGPPRESVTKSSPIEHLQPPTEDAIKVPGTGQLGSLPEDVAKNSSLEQLETPPENAVKNSIHLEHRDRRTSKSLKKKHLLKSFVNSDRVLRSRSQEKPKAPESSKNLTNVSSGGEENKKRRRRRKKKRRVNRRVADEYSRVRAQVRYFLNRISYEQSLIAAYSGEGWKGLSLEKLKPEKELQRATSEILRRKLKIRDLFQRLDSLCAEGRFPESLFDSEGQIDSEDIFCAKCGSKDLSADNDIILCDGACDRGFHQFCLEPPLLKEDIPPDDDGWLCPGCDCKVDCLDLLNESQGTNLSITDKWEKVFPEAAAGHNQDPNFGLPSDDSDDNDYDPEGPQSGEKDQGDESSSDDSDFTSASDELGTPPNDGQHLGLSSDDSEDDDYDPDGPDLDNNVKLESSSSDFTSDSEDLGAALDDNMSSGKDEGPMPKSPLNGSNSSKLGGKKRQSLNSELLSILELDPGQDGSAPVSGKRNVERLDYKKLHDEEYGNVSSHSSDDEDWPDPCLAKEEYGNVSSHSSDDEDWTDTVAPRKRQKSTGEVALESLKGNAPVNKSGTNISDIKQNLKKTENTPKRRTHRKSNFEDAKPAKSHEGSSNSGCCNKKSAYRRLGEDVTQRLYNSFKENQYPDRITKENLAKELDITFRQVSKWFENARWSFNHSSCVDADIAQSSSKKKTPSPQTNKRPLEQGPETCTRDATCNGAQSEDAPKADVAVTKCCSVDARASESATHENSRKKSITPTSRKRKGKMDHQSSGPNSRIEEMQNLPDDVPKASDMQTGSKIQTRRRKSVA